LVYDIERASVEYIADERTQASLDPYFESFSPEERAGIRAVVMDMWPAYINSVEAHLDGAQDKVVFDRFVHPNRWVSFFGTPYVLTKILITRLEAEARDLYHQAQGPAPEADADEEKREGPGVSIGPSRTEKVRSFTAEVDAPVPEEFPTYSLEAARVRLREIRYTDLPELRFAARATEMAFCQRARCFDALVADDELPAGLLTPEPIPGWISGAAFEDHLIKRTTWRRLVLHQSAPFVKGLAIRYRVKWKSERVAA